jgi:hypothetical protein
LDNRTEAEDRVQHRATARKGFVPEAAD